MTYVWLWLLAVIVAIPLIFFTLYWLAMRGEADQRQLRASGPSLAPRSRRDGPQLEANRIEALPPGVDEGLGAPR